MSKTKIYIAVGHGTMDNGKWDCGTAYNGYEEADLCFDIVKTAVGLLRQCPELIVYSDADTGNDKNFSAVREANKLGVDYYFSLHCDWHKAPTGTYPLYSKGSVKGKALAEALNNAVMYATGLPTRGVTAKTNLYELNKTNMPACIFETGSISQDIETLKDYETYGRGIAQGVCDLLGINFAGGSWQRTEIVRWWYKNPDGSYPKSEWKKINGYWFYFDADGYMHTGWLLLNGQWFYLDPNGYMLTGWQKIGGVWYFFYGSGQMASDTTTPDGYKVDENGALI